MATFYLPSSTSGYPTDNDYVKFRIKVTENYTDTNGKRLYCQLIAYRTNTGYTTNGSGSVIWYLNGTSISSTTWDNDDKPITGPSGTVMSSLYITLSASATSAKITAKLSIPNTSAGTNTNGGTVTLTEYTIKYNANGGSGAPSSQTACYKNTITFSKTKPTRTGYTFLGWSMSNTATSASYVAGGNYTILGNLTLYAVWKINTYTVTYNANEGEGAPSSKTANYCTAITISSVQPTRNGYKFLGWATTAAATTATYQAGNSVTVTKDITLYAVWEKSSNAYIRVNGQYKQGTLFIRENGHYVKGRVSIKVNGTYKDSVG